MAKSACRARCAVTLAYALMMAPVLGLAQDTDPALLDTEVQPRAEHSLLLSSVKAGDDLLVVGERGHVLVSGDGQAWSQVAQVPTRSTLNAAFALGDQVWVAGHDGVILHSADAGRSWERQRADPRPADSFDPDQGLPLLDILFVDDQRGWAVGAYALLLETQDGGATWIQRDLSEQAVPDEDEGLTSADQDAAGDDSDDGWLFSDDELELEAEENPHLNAIASTPGGRMIIAGERGAAYRSFDAGATWERLSLPYEGSMFGALTWGEDHVLLHGLRGNVLESFDFGDTWQTVESGTEASLQGGLALAGGGAVLVGAEGRVISRTRADAPFDAGTFTNADGETPILADVMLLDDGDYLVIGERGIGRYQAQ